MNVLKYKLLSILLLTVLLLTIQSCGEKQVSTTPRINQSDSINKSKIDIEKAPKLSAVYDSYDDLAYLFNHRNDTTYVINFWATWCSPCKKELDAIADYYEEWQEMYGLESWRYGWHRFGEYMDDTFLDGFLEGAEMVKHNGKYYLQYAGPGTEFSGYADGVAVGDGPLNYFQNQSDPLSMKAGGFARGAGHGATFQDNQKKYWHGRIN